MIQLFPIVAGGLFVVLFTMAAGILAAPRTPLPWGVRYTSGAVPAATAIFGFLATGTGYLAVWLTLGTILIAAALPRLRQMPRSFIPPPLPRMAWGFRLLFAGYGILYLIYALAPEIQPDAATYHLGIVYEYVRLHGFANRAEFYEILPHGAEMLFVPAFAMGAHSAAKLVHFSFLIAAVSLLRHIGHELGIADRASCCAAAILFIAPVAAVSGTSAYTDDALLCCCCSVLYLGIRWDRLRSTAFLVLAALNAGFCYTIKPTFGWVALAGLGFAVARTRQLAIAGLFTACAALPILPWTVRSLLLTGNPFAPFLNGWFANKAFTPRFEGLLLHSFWAFRPSFAWHSAILDYTVLGGNEGIFGPAFLFLPLALFALRSRSGRWLIGASLLLAMPFLGNTGTRFLLPAMAPAAIALASVLPAPAALGLVGIQAVGSANRVIDLYDTRHDWRLPALPIRAALRLEPEKEYLHRTLVAWENNALITNSIPEHARVFALAPVYDAYLDREVLGYWASAQAYRFLDFLSLAHRSWESPAELFSWRWRAGTWRAMTATAVSDVRLLKAQAEPEASTIRSWKLWKRDELLALPAPPDAAGAEILVWPAADDSSDIVANVRALDRSGQWRPMDGPVTKSIVPVDIRADVTAYIRRSGYGYILIDTANGVFADIGRDMLEHPGAWCVLPAGRNGNVWLFYIS